MQLRCFISKSYLLAPYTIPLVGYHKIIPVSLDESKAKQSFTLDMEVEERDRFYIDLDVDYSKDVHIELSRKSPPKLYDALVKYPVFSVKACFQRVSD